MSCLRCCCLVLVPDGVIGHRLQKTTNRLLIEGGDASVLLDQSLFLWRKQLRQWRRTSASQHKCSIYAALFKRRHIAKVERICSEFIVFLSSTTDPK